MSLETKVLWTEREDLDIEPLDFYKKYYFGASKEEVASADRIFYMTLCYKGLTGKIPIQKPAKPEEIKPIIEPSSLFNLTLEKALVLKKKEVSKPKKNAAMKINLFSELFQKQKTAETKIAESEKPKLIRIKKPKYTRKTPINPWVENPAAYYNEHYSKLNRKELERENSRFYKYLWRHDLLDVVPKKPAEEANKILSNSRRKNSRFGEDALAYYQEHYPGMPRGILKEKDSGLYQRLRADGLLDNLPKMLKNYKDIYQCFSDYKYNERHKYLYKNLMSFEYT